jgi:hypothetical protein
MVRLELILDNALQIDTFEAHMLADSGEFAPIAY